MLQCVLGGGGGGEKGGYLGHYYYLDTYDLDREPTQMPAYSKKTTWGMGITANKYVAHQYPVPLAGFFKTQCSGSGMFILDPDFYPSRISDPVSNQKRRPGEKIIWSCHFLWPQISKAGH